MKYFFIIFLLVCGHAFSCGDKEDFPVSVSSLEEGIFRTAECYPVAVSVPKFYKTKTLQQGVVKFYPPTEEGLFIVLGSNKNAVFETELMLRNIGDTSVGFNMCISSTVAATTRVFLTYRKNYPESYEGPVSLCRYDFKVVDVLEQKMLELESAL